MVSRSQKSEVRNQKKKRGFFGKIWHLMWADFLHYYGRMGKIHFLLQWIALFTLLMLLIMIGTFYGELFAENICQCDVTYWNYTENTPNTTLINLISGAMSPLIYFFLFSLYIRRLHDIGVSAWWIVCIMPFEVWMTFQAAGLETMQEWGAMTLSFLPLVILCFWPGQKGKNKYGEQPLGWKDV